MTRGPRAILAGLAVAAVAAPGQVAAFEEQWHLGGGVGAATFSEADTTAGPLVGLQGAYGLSDMFDVKLEAFGASHVRNDERWALLSVSAGLAYKLDIIEWIPYFGAQAGYYHLSGSERPGALGEHEPGISVDFGLDYALSRSFGLGVQFRYHGFLSDPMSSLSDVPYFTGLLRVEQRWGW